MYRQFLDLLVWVAGRARAPLRRKVHCPYPLRFAGVWGRVRNMPPQPGCVRSPWLQSHLGLRSRFFVAFSLAAAGQSEGCHCCNGFDDCCLQTLIAHLRPVLPGRSSPSESCKTLVWQHLPASSAGPAPARLRGTHTADATICVARFPRRSRIFGRAFLPLASGARLALFAGEADAIETALAMTVLCWKSFVWEPKLADVALIRQPFNPGAGPCGRWPVPLPEAFGW